MNRGNREAIQVCIRVRPLLKPYEDEEIWCTDSNSNSIYTIGANQSDSSPFRDKEIKLRYSEGQGPQSFTYDHVYGPEFTSQQIYQQISKPIVQRVLNGFNGTVFMYGQTTSGKTYTMLGTPDLPGILPCSIKDIFQSIAKDADREYSVWVSYLEIYNEHINDLLVPGSNNLKIKDDPKQGVLIQNLKHQQVWTFDQVILLMNYGEEHRSYRETSIHEHSSRSHTIFKLYIESIARGDRGDGRIRFGCLNLVDLAGSERLNEFDIRNQSQLGETGHINKSLFTLAHVINKLAEGKTQHIPYRDSKLTRILSFALGGNSLTAIVCTVSPAAMNFQQTISTLRFASRAKIVQNAPHLNEILNEIATVNEYKAEIIRLKEELSQINEEKLSLQIAYNKLERELENARKEVESHREVHKDAINEHGKDKQKIEKLEKTLEMQLRELNSHKSEFSEKYQKLLDRFQEERKYRARLENELTEHKQALAETINSEQGTLRYLNKLILDAGGTPVEIPNPSSTYQASPQESNFLESLTLQMDQDFIPEPKIHDEWTSQSNKIIENYKQQLANLQSEYHDKIQNLYYHLSSETKKSPAKSIPESPDSPQSPYNKDLFSSIKINFDHIIEEYLANPSNSPDLADVIVSKLKDYRDLLGDQIEGKYDDAIVKLEEFFKEKISTSNRVEISQLTDHHSELLKKLRDQYENMMEKLEQNYLQTLQLFEQYFLENDEYQTKIY
ncbi:unnamed protein product [Blepharisma stoltei]|uniref:Kinesin motor domain-containing protein n=1 Tax=Blepharisma stoltei TaxID=1481888 RepID=A0AAU9J4U4_9CILI|nr:unnamed protein product [Blepharisma stoltei]